MNALKTELVTNASQELINTLIEIGVLQNTPDGIKVVEENEN